MAFALTIGKLEDVLEKTGCPVCRVEHDAAARSIDAFLWENANDPVVRRPINDAYGFCPEHTLMLVATEMSNSGPVLGVNLIYEVLAKNTGQDLKALSRKSKANRRGQSFLNKFGLGRQHNWNQPVLKPKGRCPVCELVEESAKNTLSTLFEELTKQQAKIMESDQHSHGLCLKHLKIGLECFEGKYPQASNFLIQDAIRRLETQQAQMLEYIRKHNWAYRDEQLSPEERSAWLRTLVFFTGYPPERFVHQIKEF